VVKKTDCQDKIWESYEDVAREVVRCLAHEIGLVKVVDTKAVFQGAVENWEIDVAAYQFDGKLVVFECRKRSRNVEKGDMAHFAYVVEDLGAKGFLVSPRGLAKGAQNIANHHAIDHMKLVWDEGSSQRIVDFLGRFFAIRTLGLFVRGAEPLQDESKPNSQGHPLI
jgi:hypothetical protein